MVPANVSAVDRARGDLGLVLPSCRQLSLSASGTCELGQASSCYI